jgi:putative heme transporter
MPVEMHRPAKAPGVPPTLATAAGWSWRLLVVAAFIALFAVVSYQLRVVTVPVFVALLAATVLVPPAHYLKTKGVPPGLAAIIVFLATGVVLVGLVYLLASPVSEEFGDLGPQVSTAIDDVNNWLVTGPLNLNQAQLDEYSQTVIDQLRENSGSLQTGVVASATIAVEVLTGLILSIVLTFFFVKDGESMLASIRKRIPESHRGVISAASSKAFHTLGGYLRGVAATGVVDALFIGIGLWIIGVPLLLPLVLLTFFGAFFPVVGATLAGFLAAAVALVNGGPGDALLVVLLVLAVQQLESQILQPFLVGKMVALHPVVILLGLTAGAVIAGLLGAFLAVPLIAMVISAIREIERYNAKAIGPARR